MMPMAHVTGGVPDKMSASQLDCYVERFHPMTDGLFLITELSG